MTPERREKFRERLAGDRLSQVSGTVTGIAGLVIHASLPDAWMGEICEVRARHSRKPVLAEVVGFRHGESLLMALGEVGNIGPDAEVRRTGRCLEAPVGDQLLGRVLDGLGRPLDGKPLKNPLWRPIYEESPHPMERRKICRQMPVGVRAIDSMLPCGEGQRVGIFASAGGGKSTLLGMIARYAQADAMVVVLVGERGREVREFLENSLGDGAQKAVLVVATSDKPAVVRLKAAYIGTTIAEYFRDTGRKVILMMDSVTRFARAQREIGLARGEPPARYGFPPSVFAELPRLFERCGNTSGSGSLTGFYTVLVEGDNFDEPVADETRSLLDGHIVLSSRVGYRPSIELLASESRVKDLLGIGRAAGDAADKVIGFLQLYKHDETAMEFGAMGADKAARRRAGKTLIDAFMMQNRDEASRDPDEARRELLTLAGRIQLE